jgi:RNA polymerase sigma-70 factor, ECF subfamily
VQPPTRRPRRIVNDLRGDRPLAYARLSDPILVRRAKDGDERARATLWRHAPRVAGIALHILRDPQDARDAEQDSLVELVQRSGQFRGHSQFSTWLHRLVVDTCKGVAQARWAAQRRTEPLVEDTRVARDGDPARALADSESRRELARRLAELSRTHATVVALENGLDVSFGDTSHATGMPAGTAKCYAHRGRNELRARLSLPAPSSLRRPA